MINILYMYVQQYIANDFLGPKTTPTYVCSVGYTYCKLDSGLHVLQSPPSFRRHTHKVYSFSCIPTLKPATHTASSLFNVRSIFSLV